MKDDLLCLKVVGIPWTISLLDTKEGRLSIVQDFASRCDQILVEAMKWAPSTTRSHLQEYMNGLSSLGHGMIQQHAGLALTVYSILKTSETLPNASVPILLDASSSYYVASLSLRNYYLGEINGLLEASGCTANDYNKVTHKLVTDLENACKKPTDSDELLSAILRCCALFIWAPGIPPHRALGVGGGGFVIVPKADDPFLTP